MATKKELIKQLLKGKKMCTPSMKEGCYCIFSENTIPVNPFLYVTPSDTCEMDGLWECTEWSEYVGPVTQSYGWRMPTITELLTLVAYTKHYPATALTDTNSSGYWSSSSSVSDSNDAWYVHFEYGNSRNDYKMFKNFVRCVREIDDKLEWSKSSTIGYTWEEAHEYAKTLTDTNKL